MRHDLPGGWAELRSADDLTERQARPVRHAYANLARAIVENVDPETDTATLTEAELLRMIGPGYIDARDDYQDALIVAYVSAWSWEAPTTEAADVLPIGTFNALIELVVAADRQTDDFTPDGAADPKAPTDDSSDSEQPSRDASPTE